MGHHAASGRRQARDDRTGLNNGTDVIPSGLSRWTRSPRQAVLEYRPFLAERQPTSDLLLGI